METEQKTYQKRQVAYKLDISRILNSVFARDELSAGFLSIADLKVSRVNIIGTIVNMSDQNGVLNASIDDGTGRVSLRTFEPGNFSSRVEVGNIALVIGKIREYNNEKYVIPEIIKKCDNLEWISLRKKEVLAFPAPSQSDNQAQDDKLSSRENVYSLIKSLDRGEGADFDEIVKNSNAPDAEAVINKLLENGDVFEVKPGRLKVLE